MRRPRARGRSGRTDSRTAQAIQGCVRPDERRRTEPDRSAALAARSRVGQSRDRHGSGHVREGPRAGRTRAVEDARGRETGDWPAARVVHGVRDLDEKLAGRQEPAAAGRAAPRSRDGGESTEMSTPPGFSANRTRAWSGGWAVRAGTWGSASDATTTSGRAMWL